MLMGEYSTGRGVGNRGRKLNTKDGHWAIDIFVGGDNSVKVRHVGGWPNNDRRSLKDILGAGFLMDMLMGRTTVCGCRRAC